MEHLNIGAILVATVAAFFVGGLWYSPKGFLNIWLRETKIEKQIGHGPATYITAFCYYLVAACAFNCFLSAEYDLTQALKLSAYIGVAWVATSFGINYKFAGRSTKLFLIDGGYHVVQFLIYGLVFGLWPK